MNALTRNELVVFVKIVGDLAQAIQLKAEWDEFEGDNLETIAAVLVKTSTSLIDRLNSDETIV